MDIEVNFRDKDFLNQFIDTHKGDKTPMIGRNKDGHIVIVSAVPNNVDVAVIEKGWIRHDTYWIDGTTEVWYEK